MTIQQVSARLEELGDERTRAQNAKSGVGENPYGVKLGELRKLAKAIKKNHPLALELWRGGNFESQMLATRIVKPAELSKQELDGWVRTISHGRVADWCMAYVVKDHPESEEMREAWMNDPHPMAVRAGWSLTARAVAAAEASLDLSALLDRIEREMAGSHPDAQWTMNACLAEIGIHHPAHRERAIRVGEALGLYRDYPVSKGCTSPFAPIWIREMVKRREAGADGA